MGGALVYGSPDRMAVQVSTQREGPGPQLRHVGGPASEGQDCGSTQQNPTLGDVHGSGAPGAILLQRALDCEHVVWSGPPQGAAFSPHGPFVLEAMPSAWRRQSFQ